METIEILSPGKIELVEVGITGPEGPEGPAGTPEQVTLVAGEALGGQRAVISSSGQLFYADKDNPAHLGRVVGITIGAASALDTVPIQLFGELSGFSGLTPDAPIYLSNNGVLTQTVPTTGFLQKVGVAITSTVAVIKFNPPIQLT